MCLCIEKKQYDDGTKDRSGGQVLNTLVNISIPCPLDLRYIKQCLNLKIYVPFFILEQKKHHPSAEIQIITKFWRLSFVVSGIFCNFVGDND